MRGGVRVVITGVGLTSPLGNGLPALRGAVLTGRSGVRPFHVAYIGDTVAGVCEFDVHKHQTPKEVRRGTRAGSIGVFCAKEALADSRLDLGGIDRNRVGVILGITEHGTVETEKEISTLSAFDNDIGIWSHHHNPRSVANNPPGEITLNTGITGPHFSVGAACAAGNMGVILGAQQLMLGGVDMALAGGVSESIHTFGSFAAFKSQGALASHADPQKASRPFDRQRNGIVISEGGCVFVLERLETALNRKAHIYGEILGYAMTSDAADTVMPNPEGQIRCMAAAIEMAGVTASDIDIISTHATGTVQGDKAESRAIQQLFATCPATHANNTKSMMGHAMGAAAALELAGNLPAFDDGMVHGTINMDEPDPDCPVPNLVINRTVQLKAVNLLLNNAFGMLGVNACLVIGRYQ